MLSGDRWHCQNTYGSPGNQVTRKKKVRNLQKVLKKKKKFTVDGESDVGFFLVVGVHGSVPGHTAVLGAVVFLLRSDDERRQSGHTPASARFRYRPLQRVRFALPVPSNGNKDKKTQGGQCVSFQIVLYTPYADRPVQTLFFYLRTGSGLPPALEHTNSVGCPSTATGLTGLI